MVKVVNTNVWRAEPLAGEESPEIRVNSIGFKITLTMTLPYPASHPRERDDTRPKERKPTWIDEAKLVENEGIIYPS
jgi:hypothetical protein